MTALVTLCVLAAPMSAADTIVVERVDLYDPVSGAYAGTEQTHFAPDGRRLRTEITDSAGARTLTFMLLHDGDGRESGAVYFESDPLDANVETFEYGDGGRLRTVQYWRAPGERGSRTEVVLDADGREVSKRYYRTDGSQYGEEDVLWNEDGTQAGWDFRYVGREGGASFRYRYTAFDDDGRWKERVRSRNGEAERREVRTLTFGPERARPAPSAFAPGAVSTAASETSPSFTADGRTMVFAR